MCTDIWRFSRGTSMLNSMSVQIPKNVKEERLRWVKPIADGQVKLKDVAKVCEHGKRTLERWLSNYRKHGESGLEPKSTRPKNSPKETPIRIKNRVIEIRNDTKECAMKLKWKLEDENIYLNERTIGKFIKTEGLTRKYRVRKVNYKYIRAELKQGELVEIDVKYIPDPIDGKRYYQFTAVYVASRWRLIIPYDNQSNYNAINFLHEVIKVFPHKITAIKTDNAAIFTNRYTGYQKSIDPLNPKLHPLDIECQRLNIIHYLIDPGKPQQNGTVERSHRTDQEYFYDNTICQTFEELKYKMKLWNMYYNDLPHCSLKGKTPNQMLQLTRTIT